VKTALGFLVVERSARFVWVHSRRPWVVSVVRCRCEVWLLALAALVVLQMRRWLEISSLVLLAQEVPQMRHFELASRVLVQAGRR
jgi:endonuclease/exonuclease/phosphatase (EEP) superfamily protein YafD